MRRRTAVAAAALPPLLLAGLGTTHPAMLMPDTAGWWRDLHVIGLVAFPLLALGPWVAVRGRGRLLEVVVVVLGLVYAAFYTALDSLAGIGGGAETLALGPGPWVSALFGVADQVVVPAVYAFLAATVIAAVTVVATTGGARRVLGATGGVVASLAAWSYLTSHIYFPVGVVTMLVLAVGQTLVAVAATAAPAATASPGRAVAAHRSSGPGTGAGEPSLVRQAPTRSTTG